MYVGTYSDTLRHPGLRSLLLAQFLGAFNDNVYLMVVSLLAGDLGVSSGRAGWHVALVGFIFILPYFFFSGYAGHLSDVFSKRSVMICAKCGEIIVMGLALLAFWSEQVELMIAALFFVGVKSAFFSPAKYAVLPEMFPDRELSRANGLLEMSTFLAIILGTSIGGVMFAAWKDSLERVGLVLLLLAVAGTLFSLGISRVPPSGAKKPFRLSPWTEIWSGILRLHAERTLWLTVLGISYFWFLGALLKMDIILLGKEVMGIDDLKIGLLVTFLALGIGFGSLATGRLSGDKVELGLVPLGSIGMGLFLFLLSLSVSWYGGAAVTLALLGFSGGFFIVPLDALIQQRGGHEEKGRLIATNNFLNTGGILLASGVFWSLRDLLHIQADSILLLLGVFTLISTLYILTILPDFLIRFSLWLFTHLIYRIRIVGQENVPLHGPALLVCNHVSHVDALLVGACVQRFIRFMVYRPYYELRGFHWLLRLMKAIPVSGRNRKEIVDGIERAREELRQGHVVCIFAEGAISRTGNLLPFKRGFERIVESLDVPVIPVCLDRLWGSVFSFKDGQFFWKFPRELPYPVTVIFGPPLVAPVTAHRARQAVLELGTEAVQYRRSKWDLLHLRFLHTAKRRWFSFCLADSTGRTLSYGSALAAALLLSRKMRAKSPAESMLGLMLPASAGGALANVAALLAGKVPVNLNFTAGKEAMDSALEQCRIRTIISSRAFLARARLDQVDGMLFLEDLVKETTAVERLLTLGLAFILPARWLAILYGPAKPDPNSLATVVFSSGSTGTPKGVMLSHHNILSNVEAIAQIFWLTHRDRMMGVLPFFHSFGLTGTIWLPLIAGFGAVYHSNPTDAKTIGEMVAKYKATILISTPTFYAGYVRRCDAEEFSSLRYAIVGAEKLRDSLAIAFREKYGLDLLEGYGCTEMGPVVAVNVPDVQDGRGRQKGLKPATVGHPLPGVSAKVVDPDTGAALSPDQEGLLLVAGPNRMLGYLDQADRTAEVFQNGWYVTGDIASIDDDGFITITDRLARFSKIAGEMVPHLKVEEALHGILGDHGCVVVATPDEHKGERLAVLYARKEIAAEELWRKLNETDLPKLWIPRRDSFFLVEEIPLLGSGKVDLKTAKTIATERTQG